MSNQIAVIGAGFAGMAAATSLAQMGHEVTVYEKHNGPGGRARKFEVDGFVFDMGPSWYWMPDVFETYFNRFGTSVKNEYNLVRLDPSYRVYFEDGPVDIPADYDALKALFESIEKGSAAKLDIFMDEAEVKYNIGMSKFVHMPSHSPFEFAELQTAKDALKLHLLRSFSSYARKYFSHPKLLELLEFPVLFLGAKPEKTPALYSLMNYADTKLGTWYPMGGMHEIVLAMQRVAEKHGVKFEFNSTVSGVEIDNKEITHLIVNGSKRSCDAVIAGADYHHVEQHILPPEARSYSEKYWENRTMSPSSLLFYIGVDKEIPELQHHNLFFDADFGKHAIEIYDTNEWPEKPLFYACCPSKTDDSVAPKGKENLFLLIPVAPGLEENEDTREHYYNLIMERLEKHVGMEVRKHVIYKRSYAHKEFIEDYGAYKGNAYGLANTLNQTAFLKPKLKSKKLHNLYFAGQLTTPGPGVPPSLISGQVAAKEVNNLMSKRVVSHI